MAVVEAFNGEIGIQHASAPFAAVIAPQVTRKAERVGRCDPTLSRTEREIMSRPF